MDQSKAQIYQFAYHATQPVRPATVFKIAIVFPAIKTITQSRVDVYQFVRLLFIWTKLTKNVSHATHNVHLVRVLIPILALVAPVLVSTISINAFSNVLMVWLVSLRLCLYALHAMKAASPVLVEMIKIVV